MIFNLTPSPLKFVISLLVALTVLLGIVKMLSCPKPEFLLCPPHATLHEPVWSCTLYCTTALKDYFWYALELGVPFLALFILIYLTLSFFNASERIK
jgi:hypothetical protein